MSHVLTGTVSTRARIRRNPLPVVQSESISDVVEEPEISASGVWYEQEKVPREKSSFWKAYHDTWLQEAFGTLVGIVCFVLLVWVLHFSDGKPLRSWALTITPGALISILVTMMDAALTLPLSSAFGQLKWIRVNGHNQTLQKMQQMDLASRSASGRINLLLSFQGGIIGSVGAVIAILMLAVGPFAQQVLKYTDQPTFVTQASINRAVSAIEHSAQGGSYTVATLPMRAAIFNAVLGYSTNGKLMDPPFACGTGNCTWDPFISLGVRSDCDDITHLLISSNASGEGSTYSSLLWTLPSEFNNISITGWVDAQTHPYSMLNISSIQDWAWGPLPNASFLNFALVQNSLSNATEATALNCSLSFCLHQIDADVTNGQLTENITEVEGIWAYQNYSIDTDMLLTPNQPDRNHTSFLVNDWAPSALGHTMSPLINGTARATADGGMIYDSDTLMAFWTSRADIPGLMKYLATSMSTHLRDDSSQGSIRFPGGSYKTEPYIVVRWVWLALPAAVVVLIPLFALALAVETKRTKTVLWKNNMLALLLHGLDDASRARINADNIEIRSIAGMGKIADNVGVRLMMDKADNSIRLTEHGTAGD